MLNEEEEEEGIKITLLGDSRVGKTCIISKYMSNTFENSDPTSGVDYFEKIIKIGKKEVQLKIWDTAGREKYRAIGKIYYKDVNVVCLIYDITNQDSFVNLKNTWYSDFQEYGKKCNILAVVGNKCDLKEKATVNENEAREFAKEKNAIFMLTSAQSGAGINELFDTLAKNYLSLKFKSKVKEKKEEKTRPFILNNGKNDKCCQKGCC